MQKRNFSRRTITKQLGVTVAALSRPATFLGAASAVSTAVGAKAAAEADLQATPAQVEGPFHPIRPQPDTDLDLTHVKGRTAAAFGDAIWVAGSVRNANGELLEGAELDIWQANHYGRYAHPGDNNSAPLDPNFQGWGIVRSDNSGRYRIKTVKPGPYPLAALGGSGWRCRHIHFKVSCAGYQPITTQMYFRGDPLLAQDMEIRTVPKNRQALLIADSVVDEASGLPAYHFDITLAAN